MTAIGVGAIAAGSLLIYSAYTDVPLFGDKGLLRVLLTGSLEDVGKAVGEAAAAGANSGADKLVPDSSPITPPGYNSNGPEVVFV
jgi:hypothetical protein